MAEWSKPTKEQCEWCGRKPWSPENDCGKCQEEILGKKKRNLVN